MKQFYLLSAAGTRQLTKNKCLQLLIIFLFASGFHGYAQEIEWDKTYGGNSKDNLYSIEQTSDSGYILGGTTGSPISGDKTATPQGGSDYWVVKMNSAGEKEWDKVFGGSLADYFTVVQQTTDGGYVLGGSSQNNISGDKSEASRGSYDYWIIKLDAAGNKQWDKTIGGSGDETLTSLIQTTDGGYMLGGMSSSGISGEKSEAGRGGTDYWVVKINATGEKEWDRTVGSNGYDYLRDVIQTRDGGFMLGGEAHSYGGDRTGISKGLSDYWIVKLREDGTKEWDKAYGGHLSQWLYSVVELEDGGYLLGGSSDSGISLDKSEASRGSYDFWLVKINQNGVKQWDKTYGGSSTDHLRSILKTEDGGFMLGGTSRSGINGDKTGGLRGETDFWVIKVNADGKMLWDRTIGGSGFDVLEDMIKTADGSYLMGGSSSSGISGDKSEASRGADDYWIVKLNPATTTSPTSCNVIDFENKSTGFIKSVNTCAGVVHISNKMRHADGTYVTGNYASVFNTASPTGDDWDLWTPDWGNVLIINQDLNPEPNDNPWGGEMTLDFSEIGPVIMTSMKALDFDAYENNSWVYLYDGQDNELYKVKIENLGNMSQQVVDLGNTKGVMKMKVVLDGTNEHGMLAGSGAIDEINFLVEANERPQVSAGADKVLTCAVPEVILDGSSSTPGVVYSWSGPDGFTSTLATPTVNLPGYYFLTVTNPVTGLTASDNVEVKRDSSIPFVRIQDFWEDGPLTCNNSVYHVEAYTTTVNAIYAWTGPNGFTSDKPAVGFTIPGTYTLTVTDPATGCQASESISITQYYPKMAVNAGPDRVLTCKEQTVTLLAKSNGVNSFTWYSPDGGNIVSPDFLASVDVDKPGTYIIKATELKSGCFVTDTVVVTLDTEAPNITAQGGTLSSETGTVQLMGSSTTEGVTYSWTGPEGFTSAEQNPVVSVAGDYTLTVTDLEDGCAATLTVEVQPQAVMQTSAISQATVFPNPIEGKGTVAFKLNTTGNYVVELYDLKGNLIRELKAGHANAGELVNVEVDGSNLKVGLYVARIVSAKDSKTVKIILRN
jgi:hypothetical protein